MKKVTLTAGCVAAGKTHKKGATVELADAEARLLVNLGKARPAAEKKADKKDGE